MSDFLNKYFNNIGENLINTLNTPDAYLNKVVLSLIVISIGFLINLFLKYIISKNTDIIVKRSKQQKVVKKIIFILITILILFIWIQAINALVLIAILFIIFLIVMLRGLTHNITAYFVIKNRKYFKTGYRIEINGIIGDVIDINPISFKLLEVRNWLSSDSNTGRIIQVPNSIIFEDTTRMIDLDNRYIWHEINYTLTFDSDWEEAEKIIKEAGDFYFTNTLQSNLKEKSKYLPKNKEDLSPVFSLDTNDSGIIVNLRYLVDYKNATSVKTALQRKILKGFKENPKIKFAVLDIRMVTEESE